jgi:tetratricopeptide (TPR) repeat protein
VAAAPEVGPPPSLAGLDWALVGLVLVLAFLLASVPVTNSDLFRQLATGRLVSQGRYPFGANPFVFSLDGQYWVNHSWLFGLIVYLLYQLPAGGVLLVVVKALAVTLVAELMLRCARRPGQSLWLPAVCTALALVALSPYLSLSPRVASFLGVALVMWLLAQGRQSPRAVWLIPLVCLLWVNLDGWFWLGPLLVALHLAGQLLERPAAPGANEANRRLLGVLGASLAACLVNPYFPSSWRVFELPPELSPGSYLSGLREEELFRSFFLSPWNREYFDPRVGLSVAGLAYFVLLLAGVAAFILDARKLSAVRALPWLVFALLSLWNMRLIPFFAIVAGPITAQSFQSWAEGLPQWTPVWRRWAVAGRGLSLLAGVLLLVAAVPGWLQAEPHRRHCVGWGVEPNVSLTEAADRIKQWHKSGQLPQGENWFCVTPEVAHYLAWYCPGERAWIDDSLLSFPEAADDYVQLRQSLSLRVSSGDKQADERRLAEDDARWQDFFRTRNVHLVIHHNVSTEPGLRELLQRLLGRPGEWAPCHLEGHATIFAWRDPRAAPDWKQRLASLTVSVPRLAFGPQTSPAPPQGPDLEPAPSPWWQELWQVRQSASLDQGSAALHEVRFRALGPVVRQQQDNQWQAMVPASAIGFAAPSGQLPAMTLMAAGWSLAYRDFPLGVQPTRGSLHSAELMALQWRIFLSHMQDHGPPSSLYLGIRAARRALALDPDDPYTHLLLGQAYYRLGWFTREHDLTRGTPQCLEMRMAQTAGALNNVLRLQPDLALQQQAHQMLADLFAQQGLHDMHTKHRSEELRCARALGPLPGEDEESYGKRLQQLEKLVTQLEDQLSRRESQFQVQSVRRPLPERLRVALSMGLIETASREVERDLVEEHADHPPPAELLQVAQLKLTMGQVQDARDSIEPGVDSPNMQPAKAVNPWPYVQLAAARGNYDEADRHLEQRLDLLQRDAAVHEVGGLVAAALLAEAQQGAGMHGQQMRRLLSLYGLPSADLYIQAACRITLQRLQEQAECHFFRGWLALEAGHIERAREQLRLALEDLVPFERGVPVIRSLVVRRIDQMIVLQSLTERQEALRRVIQLYLSWIDPKQGGG